jgi:acetyltransferase-like isoleucine patch superfamily enzyme
MRQSMSQPPTNRPSGTPLLGLTGAERLRKAPRNLLKLIVQKTSAANSFDIGDRLTIGRYTYGKPLVRWYEGDKCSVRIGSFCAIADDIVMTIGGDHRADWPSIYPFRIKLHLPEAITDGHPSTKGDIEIGNDVWIGRGARILSGVNIGDGAVVGAYAVVAKDVRPYAIVVGNPAREVRRRFTDSQVDAMLDIAWWDWPEEKILENIEYLNQPDIEAFIARFC